MMRPNLIPFDRGLPDLVEAGALGALAVAEDEVDDATAVRVDGDRLAALARQADIVGQRLEVEGGDVLAFARQLDDRGADLAELALVGFLGALLLGDDLVDLLAGRVDHRDVGATRPARRRRVPACPCGRTRGSRSPGCRPPGRRPRRRNCPARRPRSRARGPRPIDGALPAPRWARSLRRAATASRSSRAPLPPGRPSRCRRARTPRRGRKPRRSASCTRRP